MSLTNLTPQDLATIATLLTRRVKVAAELAAIEAALAVIEQAVPAGKSTTARGAPRKNRKISQEILEALRAAGKAGLTVRQLAETLGVKANRIYTWFYVTGSSNKAIKKLGEAHYCLQGK